ncbi:hypothetical protein GLOTRDRAFT_41884 [Gloeophyllum trabeum ATCC 11539]|uniref:Trafficking protein particle complex subunit 11 n=1 Tax=Gloeophyllum trabeum (strain ATCC 11539 / FP-39264 / Madison 617) TaxID=670483 RepID=S7Q596_GLOTA|nr:uncharacterized protein GLOTRDRAFT_41884 [Gloeophyllum trabeum ATCC 11539]EPQ55211.1 hypothetical protein GLOTRDRAFT_41884 [Gloeophyllum trabeum ATCC 11539]
MNSYPPELLVQLAPVMFVAGLEPAAAPKSPAAPHSPAPKTQDPFVTLSTRLRDALVSQRKVAVWQHEKSKTFQVVLVDKEVRFPPRKIYPPDEQQSHVAHSPLSPLTPTSPLYPDGLIAPIWIRKHTTLVPSVFVLFMRLYEHPAQTPKSPLDPPDADREREREQEERHRDTELSAEIAQRKKSTSERGIKLTVVLMASRKMLDDPSLDSRLTYIRRQSGLDSRASLFVLSPVTAAELNEFVQSLQQALWDPAIEYYTSHSKRVRRKRNRHTQSGTSFSSALSPLGSAGAPRPLRSEGWTVRYEYKMACFAEFRGEEEVALKHYQDAYEMLVTMFGLASMLPARTKRWAEAKVLADCINVKICKLYLYNEEHALALSQHNSHVRKFSDLSRSWGIGEDTFEFWSWMARQYRILAELLEQGIRANLKIPSHRPAPALSAATPTTSAGQPGVEMDAMRSLGVNPSHTLQHPGFYYYTAARCTERRRERFLASIVTMLPQEPRSVPPGYTNEKKVDHLTIILELYTKSYELFKQYAPANTQNQGRQTLYIAYRIAQTYYDSGKFDMAVRFFERIAKTYRRESWGSMMAPLLSTWYRCAQQLGDVELSVRLLIEMIGHGEDHPEDSSELAEDLLAVMQSTAPSSSDEAVVVDLSESEPIFDSEVVFWKSEATVEEEVAFQLTLTAPSGISIASLPFTALSVFFSGDAPSFTIQHVTEPEAREGRGHVRRVDLGHVPLPEYEMEASGKEVTTHLRWHPGEALVLTGNVKAPIPTVIKVICRVVLALKEGNWWIEIPFDPNIARVSFVPNPRWLWSLDPVRYLPLQRLEYSFVTIRYQPHQLRIRLHHQEPAYLNEEYPITIDITNIDGRELEVVIDALLHPTELDDAEDHIRFGEEESSSLIKGISFGILAPSVNVFKTLYLTSTCAPGDRMLDISIQSRSTASLTEPKSPVSPATDSSVSLDTSEELHTLIVPTVEAIKVNHEVTYRRTLDESQDIDSISAPDADFLTRAHGIHAVVATTLECVGPWGLSIERVTLHRKTYDSSLKSMADPLPEWLPGDEYRVISRLHLTLDEDENYEENPVPEPANYEVFWRRILPNGESGPASVSRFPMPSLQPPGDGLVALVDVPSTARLHSPLPLRLTVRNGQVSRSANITVQLEPEPSDGFIVAGLRSGRLPILLPGAEETILWQLIPLECGFVKIPNIKVIDRRKAAAGRNAVPGETDTEGESVKVIDIRWEGRGTDGGEDQMYARRSMDSTDSESDRRPPVPTILVLP